MKTLARGLAAVVLLSTLAACADLGAMANVQIGDATRVEPAKPLAYTYSHASVLGHVNDAATTPDPHVQMPDLSGSEAEIIRGPISWYGPRFAGRRTANGEIFDPRKLTMAHRKLPFNTRVRVTNPETGASVVVRVNDRGPYIGDRVADLSHAAAKQIGMVKSGVIDAELEILRDEEELGEASAGHGPALPQASADASRATTSSSAPASAFEPGTSAGRTAPATNAAP